MYKTFHITLRTLAAILLIASILHSSFAKDTNGSNAMIMDTVIVFAGNDTSICQSGILTLSDLNASISGLVTDGYWFTNGDGFFNPNGMNFVQFSQGQTYIPGANDIITGYVDLILTSDDPDGIGPMSQVTDLVRITLQGNPTLVCHGALNISLGNDCTELVTPQMLLINPIPPLSQYVIVLTDEQGDTIPNNTLTVNELEQQVTFSISHLCGTTSCWGLLTPQDKTAPVLQCANYEIDCDENSSPDSIGFPVTNSAIVTSVGQNTYNVLNLDACSDVLLIYEDIIQDLSCLNGLQERIIRKWTATDESNNSSQCTQVISINVKSINDVVFPPNYNHNPLPPLECGGNWLKLPNGHPDPEFTGKPDTDGCSDIESTYSDITFDLCGNSYKLLREWLVVDWCTNETKEHNQVIKIDDTTPPTFNVPDSLIAYTSAYDCLTDEFMVPLVQNIVDCSGVDTSFFLRDTFDNYYNELIRFRQDTFYIDSLPVGYYEGNYVMIDECNNKDTMSFPIKVEDNKIPFAICDQFTKVTVTSSGTARMYAISIDDNSVDNCAIDSLAVAKMEDLCGHGANAYGPYVDFCCLETGQPIMVALRVTDIYGNENTCMSQVTVEDKEAPILSCPSDFTISCEYDIDENNLSVFGKVALNQSEINPILINGIQVGTDGFAEDNCDFDIDSTYTLNTGNCASGTLIRTFTAKDLFGNENSCTQTIQIINNNPFNINNITWPPNVEVDGCDTLDLDLSITQVPTYTNTHCADVVETYKDQYFFNTQEACIKVLRTWTVVNWCDFDPDTGEGLYEYAQLIKLNNDIAPVLESKCQDTILCMFDLDCGPANFLFDIKGNDDCTDSTYLQYYWEIDEDNDGSINYFGQTSTINVDLYQGQHTVYTEIIDQCGNSTDCSFLVTARDCKRPTPYCVSNLTTVVMPSSKEITVKAYTFDYDSYDNCTPRSDLIFSFSSDIKDSLKTISCNDLSNGISEVIMIEMYVTDEEGNQDFCQVELTVQDSDDVCDDVGSLVSIEGEISTYKNKNVSEALVKIDSEIDVYDQNMVTEEDGQFYFPSLPTHLNYNVSVDHIGDIREGVSTLDLIVLQRHILGITPLTSPYQLIAGDANGSGKLNVSDLVAIRKVLLGITNEFAPSVPSWRFVDKNYQFEDEERPFDFNEEIDIESLNNNNGKIDFIGIKIGDVNASAGHLRSGDLSENRSKQLKEVYLHKRGNHYEVSIGDAKEFDGMQLSFAIQSMDNLQITEEFKQYTTTVYQDGILDIIMYLPYPTATTENQVLFIIEAYETPILNYGLLSNELYVEGTPVRAKLEMRSNKNSYHKNQQGSIRYENGSLMLENINLDGSIQLFTSNGTLVYDGDINGRQQIKQPLYTGIYFAIVDDGTEEKSYKVVAIQ